METIVKKSPSLKTQVYELLKEKIIMGVLKPGERLIEEKISEELGVSRSPIREAIRMLEKDGILHVNGSSGVTVVEPTIEDYQHLYECRVEVEPLAAYYAALRSTDEGLEKIRKSLSIMESIAVGKDISAIQGANIDFHEAIVEASLNPFLISMVSQIRVVNSFYRKAILKENPKHFEEALAEHQDIYRVIVDRKADDARRLMKEHIESDYILFIKQSLKE